MNLANLANGIQKTVRDNSPVILTALGVSGTLGTAYLAGRASWQAAMRLGEHSPYLTPREKIEEVWDLYIPAAISGVVTAGCIIGSNRISSNRAAAAYSVLAIVEKGFSEYRENVVEKLGERKEREIRDEVAQKQIQNNPPPTVVIGSGSVLCCELFTGRYFNSDMETLRKAENTINAKINGGVYALLSDFYYLIGLPQTSNSSSIGWDTDKQLSIDFSTVMSEDSRPCLAFEYNYVKPI